MRIELSKEKQFTPYSIVIENEDDEKKLLAILFSAITRGDNRTWCFASELRSLINNK